MKRYTVWYKGYLFDGDTDGYLFDGDTDGYNEHGYDNFEDAIALYYAYGNIIHIKDNVFGINFDYGEWN